MRNLSVLAVSALSLLLTARPMLAQQTGSDTLPVARLAPVVVEILRTPVELRRVPFAVAVVAGRELTEAKPGLALDEALRAVPGVQVDNRYNYALGERISIRGFGARTQFGVRGVRVVVDGIPATFADGQSSLEVIDPSSVERVEVVRGPASALYGNSAGGVLLFRSVPPPLVPLRQEVRVVSGENGLLRLQSRTGGRSGGTAYQLRASRLGYDGYREHSAFETLHLSGQVQQALARGEIRVSGNFVDFTAQNPGALSLALLEEDRFQAVANNVRQGTGKDGRQGQLAVWLQQPLGGSEVELSVHAQRREITNPIPVRVIDLDRSAAGVRALVRGEIPIAKRRISWTAGTDLDAQWDDRQNFSNVGGNRDSLQFDQYERVTSVGAFAQLIVPVTDALSVLGGVRADRFRFRVEDRFVTDADPDDSGEIPMGEVSPSVGVIWNMHPAAGIYANVAKSFETPTTTELANRPDGAGGFNPELRPQQAWSYELGVRGTAGPWGEYQLAAYRADVTDLLLSFQVPDVPGRDFFRNAGSAVYRGIEAALAIAPLPRVSARISYTHTDAVFRSYEVRGEAFDGNRVPGVAPHRAETSLRYQLPGGIYFGMDGSRVSAVPVNDANLEGTASPAYTLFNGRIGHREVRVGRVDVAPFIGLNNLLDVEYNTAVTINAFGNRFYEPGPGRALYLGVEVGAGR